MTDWHSTGGTRPDDLLDSDRVLLRYRDGIESKVRIVGDLRWSHDDLPDDILSWRFSHHEEAGHEA